MPGKVLIADDSVRIQRELAQLLQDSGIEVATVSNGEHAVRQLPTLQPDLVLADIFMPVRTGYEVCAFVKDNPEFAHVRVLLLASTMEPYDEREAKRVGADGRIEKPFANTQQVLATIKRHLEKVLALKPPPPLAEPAAEPEPETAPEPDPEMFSTRPPPVTFDAEAAPMGFSEMVEEKLPAEASPPETEVEPAAAAEAPVPAAEVAPAEEPTAPPEASGVEEELPGETRFEPLAAAEEPPPAAEILPQEPKAAEEETVIEKPELAEAWQMTGPQPGAPEIPPAGGWESQWTPGGEETRVAEDAPAPAVEEQPEPVAEEEPAPGAPPEGPADELPPRVEPAAAFGAAAGEAEPPPAEEEAAPEIVEEATAAAAAAAPSAATELDPAVVDDVVNKVMERLSPQVLETIAREVVRPLAESLLRAKLKD